MGRSFTLSLVCALGCAGGVGLGDETAEQTGGNTSVGASSGGTTAATATGPGETSSGTADTSTSGLPTSTGDTDSGSSSSGGDETTTGDDEPHPELYPTDRTHSPISAYVADRMRAIAAAPAGVDKRPEVFAKIGGSTSASPNFMQCFQNDAAIKELPPELMPTVTHYRSVDLGMGVSSFDRVSAAAQAGFNSTDLVTGGPTPINDEIATILPRFAHVLVGTHDLEKDQPAELYTFADNLLTTVDTLITIGVVPILSTIPQRSDLPMKDPYVPRYNAVVRAVAQGRQVPLVDLNRELAMLPNLGLTGMGDLSVFVSAMVDRPCHFSESALQFGYNVRNLEDLRALDRAKQVVVDEVAELDPPGPRLKGAGTPASPYQIPSLPFVDLQTTADSPSDSFDMYTGVCDANKDESGPERVYRFDLPKDVALRVMVFDRGMVDVDVQVLQEPTPDKCLSRNDKEISGPLGEGTYYLVVDSFAGNVPNGAAGEYMLVVMAD